MMLTAHKPVDIWKGYNICNKLDKNLSSKCFEAQQLVRINESFWPIKMVAFDQLLVSSLPLSQLSESSFLIGKLRFGWSFDSTYWPLFLMLFNLISLDIFNAKIQSLMYVSGLSHRQSAYRDHWDKCPPYNKEV